MSYKGLECGGGGGKLSVPLFVSPCGSTNYEILDCRTSDYMVTNAHFGIDGIRCELTGIWHKSGTSSWCRQAALAIRNSGPLLSPLLSDFRSHAKASNQPRCILADYRSQPHIRSTFPSTQLSCRHKVSGLLVRPQPASARSDLTLHTGPA